MRSYFSIETPTQFPAHIRAGVIRRSSPPTYPGGASFWIAGSTPPRQISLNRRILAAQLGVTAKRMRFVRQTHGTNVVERYVEENEIPAADGQWTRARELVLAANVADCCPVVLVGPDRCALLHSGWRGTAAGIVAQLCELWERDGVPLAECRAWIGPCAEGDQYEVGPEVVESFRAYPAALRDSPRGSGYALLDLAAVIQRMLTELGVTQIEKSPNGTIGDRRYHSYRRDGASSGRMLAFALRV